MIETPSELDKSTGPYKLALWIWTILASVITGIAFGYAFGEGTTFAGWWVAWGVIAGALSTVPFWALYGLGGLILRNVNKLRSDLAAAEAPATKPVA